MIDTVHVMDNMPLGLNYSGLTPGPGWGQFHAYHLAGFPKEHCGSKKENGS